MFVPEKLKTLAQSLNSPLYIVGGTCRDFLAGLDCSVKKDWDICAPVSAEEVERAALSLNFAVNAVYKNTGTVRLCADREEYEFTSFRSDRYVRGVHTPEEVFFTDDIFADARRRDFKCNAVYYDILRGQFVDPLGGTEDIERKRLSAVAPAEKVFGEDGLRLMRLCRIAAETGFTPDNECMAGAKKNAALISDIAPERIWTELNKILYADERYGKEYGQYFGARYLFETGAGDYIFPELAEGRGVKQRAEFHNHDVLEHSLRCLKYADRRIRLAALFHDVGKPRCIAESGSFAGHEVVGEEIADGIFARLRLPKRVSRRACELIKYHMYDYNGQARENKIRKFIVLHGDVLDDLLLLKQADFSACKDDLSPAPTVVKWKNIIEKMKKEGAPFSLSELKIRGDMLIGAGISPDEVGETLQFLLYECAIAPQLNRKKTLIRLALGHSADKQKFTKRK